MTIAEKRTSEIDAGLLEELRRRAREQGHPEGDLLEEAVRRYLDRPGSLTELFERIDQGRSRCGLDLTEAIDEAPHGRSKLQLIEKVGTLEWGAGPSRLSGPRGTIPEPRRRPLTKNGRRFRSDLPT